MTNEQWQRTKHITADALELAPSARSAFVRKACGHDSEVQQEVLRLISESEQSDDSFLAIPPVNLRDLLAEMPQPEPRFAEGQVVAGRFRVDKFLGRGGMGEVYKATDLQLRVSVALKTIKPAIAASTDGIERFKTEVKESRRITHACVCRVYDLFTDEQAPKEPIWFLTMELLEGRTLAEYLAAEGPISEAQAIALIDDMTAALSAAHHLGIVHRDFKPSNVMLVTAPAGRMRAVVTDFGLALNVSTDEAPRFPGAGDGTPAYRSPEQTAGRAVGLAADQYALGLVICEMLTGSRPDLDRFSAQEASRQLDQWLKRLSSERLSARARQSIRRCLQFRPEDRFQRVRDVAAALDPARAKRRARRMATIAGVAAALALVFFLAVPGTGPQVTGAVQLTADSGLSNTPAISWDGRWVVYSSDRAESGNQDIWIQPSSGGQAKRITTNPAVDDEPTISPDGKLVAFRSEREGGGIYLVNSDGTNEHLLVAGGRSPTFSPDGRRIAYWVGARNDDVPSGRLYIVSPEGGQPLSLAAGFADARYPTWNSSGRYLLFDGCRVNETALSACTEWWTVRADGRDPRSTGALERIKSRRIEIQTPPLKAWVGNEVYFSGAQGSASSLWVLKLSPDNTSRASLPQLVASGGARDREPAVAESRAIVFGRTTGALHIWKLSSDAHGGEQTAERITDGPSLDGCPSVSADGRWLFFTRRIRDVRQLMVRDLLAGRESVTFTSDDDKFWPATSPAGDKAVFEIRRKSGSSLWLTERSGQPRRLCSGCSHPTGWFARERAVFYTTQNGEIALLDTVTANSRVILVPRSGTLLGGADWNSNTQYLLFTVERQGAAKQAFAVRFPADAPMPIGSWIQLTSEAAETEQPRWSSDGKAFYFLSRRDGDNCVWRRSFDVSTGLAGPPLAVKHYHDLRFAPDRASPLTRGLTVSAHSVFLNIGEVTDTLWMGNLVDPSFTSILRGLPIWR